MCCVMLGLANELLAARDSRPGPYSGAIDVAGLLDRNDASCRGDSRSWRDECV